ncbi:hypothetical protein EON65_19565 [archaeon]|nr:MAG: hypothetical protein EON65_19565 [archaeon]
MPETAVYMLFADIISFVSRCFLEGEEGDQVSQHGSPRRTLVLLLAETTLYLLQYGQYKLAQSCLSLALEAEAAVVEKAKIKNKSATSPPHIRYLLKKAQVEASWGHYPVLNSSECKHLLHFSTFLVYIIILTIIGRCGCWQRVRSCC